MAITNKTHIFSLPVNRQYFPAQSKAGEKKMMKEKLKEKIERMRGKAIKCWAEIERIGERERKEIVA